jgi:hypothetical protein
VEFEQWVQYAGDLNKACRIVKRRLNKREKLKR